MVSALNTELAVQPKKENVVAYSEKVIDHYENPRNVGKFDDEDESVGTGMVGAPACGARQSCRCWAGTQPCCSARVFRAT